MAGRWKQSSSSLVLGVGDDAAAWRPSRGFDSLFTSDLLVENVHFSLKTASAWQLGAKSVAASLSDIAAMGGLPRLFLSSIAAPKRRGLGGAFFEGLAEGARAWAQSFGAELAGGDLSATAGPLVLDIHMVGEVEQGRALRRSGARPGDWIVCTGHPGDSAAGLALLSLPAARRKKAGPALVAALGRKHLLPLPRVLAGRWLAANRAASSCIDISDGVAGDAGHLVELSGVGLDLDAASLPLSPAALAAGKALRKDPLEWALRGGEDYELLFTVPEKKMALVMRRLASETGTLVSVIGRVVKKKGLRLRTQGRLRRLEARGYTHF